MSRPLAVAGLIPALVAELSTPTLVTLDAAITGPIARFTTSFTTKAGPSAPTLAGWPVLSYEWVLVPDMCSVDQVLRVRTWHALPIRASHS
jgi:hypothetical protein